MNLSSGSNDEKPVGPPEELKNSRWRQALRGVRASAQFFFSSRRRHTRFSRDWSSDVCSSDLSPRHCGPKPATHAKFNALRLVPLVVKLTFNNLSGLFRRGHKFPFLQRVLARLHQQGVATNNTGSFHASIRSDYNFDFYFAADVHATGELRIGRHGLGFYFPFGLVG